MPNIPPYSQPNKAIGQLGLTGDLNAAYAQIAAITTWINAQTGSGGGGTPGTTKASTPTGSFNSQNRVYTVNTGYATARLLVSTLGGSFTQASSNTVQYGAGAYAEGYYQWKISASGTESESDILRSPEVTPQSTGANTKDVLIVTDGDSRTFSPTPENPWPDQLRTAIGSGRLSIVNRAVGGYTTQDLLNKVVADVDSLYDANKECFYVLFIGINDFHGKANRDTAATKANIETAVRGRVQRGFKVLPCIETRIDPINGGNYTAQLEDVANHIKANAASWGAARVVDLAGMYAYQNYFDRNMCIDGLHNSPVANGLIAREVKRALDLEFAQRGLPVTPYTFPVDSLYEGGPATVATENVTWVDLLSATANGNSLTLSGNGATAHSSRAAGPSTAPVRALFEVTLPALVDATIGWSDNASGRADFDDSQGWMFFQSNGQFRLFGGTFGPYSYATGYAAGDTFRCQIERGPSDSALDVMTCYRNGTRVLSWLADMSNNNLQLDTATSSGANYLLSNVKFWAANPIGAAGPPATPAPTLTSIDNASGAVGSQRILTGTGFTNIQAVRFNGTAATAFTVNSTTRITVTVPNGATTGNVTVTGANGTSNGLAFNVTSAPVTDTMAATYSTQAGQPVNWRVAPDLYSSADGGTVNVQYAISHAYSAQKAGPSSATIRAYFEYTLVNPGGCGFGFIRAADEAPKDTAQTVIPGLGVQTTDTAMTQRILGDLNSSFSAAAGDVVRLQVGIGGCSLFINGVFKGSLGSSIPAEEIYLAIQGNGNQTYANCQIWAANPA